MTTVNIDLSNYRDRVGTRVPEGTYTVLVEDADLDKSSNGNQMITLWLVVQDPEFAGATVVDRLTITDKALFRVVGFMSAIGMPTPKKKFSIDVKRFINKRLMIEVADGEPYMGRIKSEVRGYLRLTSGSVQAAAVPDLDDLEEMSLATDTDAGTVASVPRAEDLEFAEIGDDDAGLFADEGIDIEDIEL